MTDHREDLKHIDTSFQRLRYSVLGLLYVTVLDEAFDNRPDEKKIILNAIDSSIIAFCEALESWGSDYTGNNLLRGIEELKLNKQVSEELIKDVEKLTKKR